MGKHRRQKWLDYLPLGEAVKSASALPIPECRVLASSEFVHPGADLVRQPSADAGPASSGAQANSCGAVAQGSAERADRADVGAGLCLPRAQGFVAEPPLPRPCGPGSAGIAMPRSFARSRILSWVSRRYFSRSSPFSVRIFS